MQTLNLKSIWIPIEILIDKNLSDKEKTIGYCCQAYVTIKYFRKIKKCSCKKNRQLL